MQNSVAPVGGGLDGGLDQAWDVEPRGPHGGGEQPGLAAEVAVLGAAAGLQADDALDLDLGPAVAHPHLVGELQQLGQPFVAEPQADQRLLLAESDAPLEHLLAGYGEDVGHGGGAVDGLGHGSVLAHRALDAASSVQV